MTEEDNNMLLSVSEYVPYSGIPVILSTISLSTCMVPPHYIRGGTPPPSLVNQNPRVYATTWYQSYEICFRCLLQCRDGGTLKPKIGLEVLRNLPYETLKKKKRYLRISFSLSLASLKATVPGRNHCGVFTPPES